jgi:hypothetical protein
VLPILHICKEAKEIGLRFYSIEFGHEVRIVYPDLAISFRKRRGKVTIPRRIYVNWAADIICPIARRSVHRNVQDEITMYVRRARSKYTQLRE